MNGPFNELFMSSVYVSIRIGHVAVNQMNILKAIGTLFCHNKRGSDYCRQFRCVLRGFISSSWRSSSDFWHFCSRIMQSSQPSFYKPRFTLGSSYGDRVGLDTAQSTNLRFPTDLREPRQIQSPSLSPITHGRSSSSPSSRSPFASSLTRSAFHAKLKTWFFGKSFPP